MTRRDTSAEVLESLASVLVRYECQGKTITAENIIDAVARCRTLLNGRAYETTELDRLTACTELCKKLIPSRPANILIGAL